MTPADIAKKFDVSVNTARGHMNYLQEDFKMRGQPPAEGIQEQKEEQRIRSRTEDADAREGVSQLSS